MARRYGGLGIGLSVVRLLAELHGGRAWAESAGEGLGAVFFVRLPVGHDLEAALPLPEPEARANPTGHPGTILLVDDAEDTLEVMRTFLEDAGFRVAVARSADAAVTEARRIGPDVILSDLAMPDRDGFALLQELRSDPRLAATPVVAVTSYASARDRQVVGDAGFDGYLAKPADQGELLETVTAALARRR
jgi:CheY-like chemotaxis protein